MTGDRTEQTEVRDDRDARGDRNGAAAELDARLPRMAGSRVATMWKPRGNHMAATWLSQAHGGCISGSARLYLPQF